MAYVAEKTRVQLIASVLLVFAGTEVIVSTPYILDIALMIDVGGTVVVVSALRSSVSISMMQLGAVVASLARPFFLIYRLGQLTGYLGTELPRSWYRCYFLIDRISTRCCALFLATTFGPLITEAVMGHR